MTSCCGFSMGRKKSRPRRLSSRRSPGSRAMGFPNRPAGFRLSGAGRDERIGAWARKTHRDLGGGICMNKGVELEKRDYSLVGPSAQRALELGLASAEWYRSDVPRATMKELVRRSDAPAIRDTIIWIAAILVSAAGLIYF